MEEKGYNYYQYRRRQYGQPVQNQPLAFLLRPASWFPKLIEAQVDLITNAIDLLTSSEPKNNVIDNRSISTNSSSNDNAADESRCCRSTTGGSNGKSHHLLTKVGYGFLGVVHMCTVLTAVMAVAVVLGVGIVKVWVEEPVVVEEKLYFDYTALNPEALFVFGRNRGGGGGLMRRRWWSGGRAVGAGVPVGQTFFVNLELVLPESDYNREMGVFQVTTEIMSREGEILAWSGQPCMLRFRSQPLRLMRSLTMGVPLLLGITSETQKLTMKAALQYKQVARPRAESIRVVLIPRAGTPYLPQLYEAQIRVNSQLPWRKKLVYDWRRTLYVCTSMYLYGIILSVLLCRFRSLLFPVRDHHREDQVDEVDVQKEAEVVLAAGEEEMEYLSEKLRKWQQYRKKRKAELLSSSSKDFPPDFGGSSGTFAAVSGDDNTTAASSYTVNKDYSGITTEEGVGDSESVCL